MSDLEDTRENPNMGAAPDEPASESQDTAETSPKVKKQFRDFVDESVRIAADVGSSIGQAIKGVAGSLSTRDHVVMVRVDSAGLDRIDKLVDAGIFKSRSESAAYLIARGAEADAQLFDRLEAKVAEINRLKEELRGMVAGPRGAGEPAAG